MHLPFTVLKGVERFGTRELVKGSLRADDLGPEDLLVVGEIVRAGEDKVF